MRSDMTSNNFRMRRLSVGKPGEQQSAASRHGGHAVSLSPAYLATQAATMDFAAYKKYKETNEPFRASEPLQVPRPAPPCTP